MFTCRHPPCGKQFGQRRALGLCSACYRDDEARKLYQEATVKHEPLEWHPFAELFPLLEGDEKRVFDESILKTKGNETPVAYRVVNGKKQGLDGRNRERSCLDQGLECNYVKVFLADDEVKEFILRKNVHRRHMTRELRQQIVGDLRAEGKSTRQIAEAVGISQATVRNDLKEPGEQNCSAEDGVPNSKPFQNFSPETHDPNQHGPQKVVGKDGKTYSAIQFRDPKPPPEVETYAPAEEPESVETFAPTVEPEHPPEVEDYGDAYEGEEDDEPPPVGEPTRPIPTSPRRTRNQPNGVQYLERDLDAHIGVVVRMVNQRSTIYGKDGRFKATWGYLSKFIDELADWRKEKAQ